MVHTKHRMYFPENSRTRRTATHSLAAVGFITLLTLGIWLAVYSTRFVPSVVNGVGAAAVSLSSVFTNAPAPSLPAISTASTTIPFEEAGSTLSTGASSTPAAAPAEAPIRPAVAPTAGKQTTGTYPISGTTTPALSGLPDLAVTINAVGYLATSSADSFIASSTVPVGNRPAVRFTIKNIGTNVTGTWYFSATIPTQTSYLYQSLPQQSLNPGDSIDYTLGFDQANRGAAKVVTIIANYNHAIAESNTDNDTASTSVTILGS